MRDDSARDNSALSRSDCVCSEWSSLLLKLQVANVVSGIPRPPCRRIWRGGELHDAVCGERFLLLDLWSSLVSDATLNS